MVRYSHPEMFFLLLPFTIMLIWYLYKGKKIRSNFSDIGIKSVRSFLFNHVKDRHVNLRSRLLILGVLFMIFASIGPQVGVKLTELTRQGVDIFILLDTSTSMNATDVKPSRMEKAKYELGRLLNDLNGDRVGLIAFAGSAHLHCPLTEDYSAARLFLNMMDTNLIYNQGTNLAEAIKLALENIEGDDSKFKVILLVSDGEDHQGVALDVAKQAKEKGVIIHSLGVGTIAGAPIPLMDEKGNRIEFKKNKNGQIVTSTLNELVLHEISDMANGMFVRIENQANAILPILSVIKEMEKKEIKSHVFSQYENRYQFFLIIGLLFFIIEFFISTRNDKEMIWQGRFIQNKK
ncbi:MAG: VWA domain-containing protein [Candidatus Neomarinimicrobiota bacterium]|nr:VWA domain-containing protein [Candidatus Neomarinimicrobiota bacterium]